MKVSVEETTKRNILVLKDVRILHSAYVNDVKDTIAKIDTCIDVARVSFIFQLQVHSFIETSAIET